MNRAKIEPSKITKPFQLAATWFTALVIINGSFLAAAAKIKDPSWAPELLVIAAVLNVPIVLCFVFRLMTEYRVEMQEDQYYAEYLARKHPKKPDEKPIFDLEKNSAKVAEAVVERVGSNLKSEQSQLEEVLREAEMDRIVQRTGFRRSLSELFLRPEGWRQLVAKYGHTPAMLYDIDILESEGLITKEGDDITTCRLTELGRRVAEKAAQDRILWYPGD